MVPTSDQQIIQEAIRKADHISPVEAEYRVGFAEGVVKINDELFTCVWCAVLNTDSSLGLSGGLHIRLSSMMERHFNEGKLTPEHIERFIQTLDEKPYNMLVKGAIKMLEKS